MAHWPYLHDSRKKKFHLYQTNNLDEQNIEFDRYRSSKIHVKRIMVHIQHSIYR